MSGYRGELIQVAASALVAAQVAEIGTTALDVTNEGVAGRFALERLLDEVRKERRFQEHKFGVRGKEADPYFWLLVLLEEVGEVAEEVAKTRETVDNITKTAIALGTTARHLLEMR